MAGFQDPVGISGVGNYFSSKNNAQMAFKSLEGRWPRIISNRLLPGPGLFFLNLQGVAHSLLATRSWIECSGKYQIILIRHFSSVNLKK